MSLQGSLGVYEGSHALSETIRGQSWGYIRMMSRRDQNSIVVCMVPEGFPRATRHSEALCIFYIDPLLRH